MSEPFESNEGLAESDAVRIDPVAVFASTDSPPVVSDPASSGDENSPPRVDTESSTASSLQSAAADSTGVGRPLSRERFVGNEGLHAVKPPVEELPQIPGYEIL